MKKMLVTLITLGLMSTSTFAYTGKVGTIYTEADGTIKVSFIKEDQSVSGGWPLVGTVDAQKNMLALLLTAKTTEANVDYYINTVNGDKGWFRIDLK